MFARSMPAEGTAAKTAIAPRLLNEQLRSATHLSPCHDPACWPTIANSVHPSQISVALVPTLAKWREVRAQNADQSGYDLRQDLRGRKRPADVRNWDDPPSLLTVKIAAQAAACGTSKMSGASPTSAWRAPAFVSASGTPPSDTATTSGPAGPWLSSLRILTWAMKASMLPSSHASERSPVHEGHPRIGVRRPLGPQA